MKKVAKTLQELVKLDYDAIEAYEEAIERLDDAQTKARLGEFCEDHRRHTREVGALLTAMNEKVPTGPDAKRMLTEGKVKLADLMGQDQAILRAMQANEKVTNETYEKALKVDELGTDARDVLTRNLEDERRHKAWIETRLEQLKAA